MKWKKVLFLPVFLFLLCLSTACAGNAVSSIGEVEEIGEIKEIKAKREIQADISQPSFFIERTACVSSVSIDFYTDEQSTKMGDDTILYTSKCVYPVVAIEGNESAADKINADIWERVEAFRTNASSRGAIQDYQKIREDNPERYFVGYFDEEIFTAARADNKVISFLVTSQYYIGGAHGMYYYTGLNYDTQTGERIDFADLSGNVAAFWQDALAFIQEIASSAAYRGIMWGNDADELQEVLYQEHKWYLSTAGLIFFSNPYELGPFCSGEIEFLIPYSDLEAMGLKDNYAYTGTKTIQLQTEEIHFLDLDGDGEEEEIQFYIDEMGSGDTNVHFFIDGIDYAVAHEELSRQLSDDNYIFCWAECFLYDVDSADTTTEIAFQMNYTTWKDDIVTPYTFLYRYEGGGILTYLGRIEGTITDPTAAFHITKSE
ncbi:MAG: DUF3298 and DUF4163 domain-containing protein [Lachnospiraceae bacterium]